MGSKAFWTVVTISVTATFFLILHFISMSAEYDRREETYRRPLPEWFAAAHR